METGMDRIETLRKSLTLAEAQYSKALDLGAYNVANFISKSIDKLREILTAEITAADPHTTEADVRHFESWV
jgi:hypothetical protein